MRRRQEEGMADAPHTNPNPTSAHIEYVSMNLSILMHTLVNLSHIVLPSI